MILDDYQSSGGLWLAGCARATRGRPRFAMNQDKGDDKGKVQLQIAIRT
jgi:hypothetical protein